MPVNTSKSPRRPLRFNTPDDAIAEATRIAHLQIAGTIEYSGNWTAGQILNHVAAWAEYAYTPNSLKAPWLIKLLVRPMKNRILNNGLPSGKNIPKVPGGTLHTEPVPPDQALAHFIKIFTRLKTDPPTQPSPVFGALSHEEAIKLNLRHAELHMSFVKN